jgi:hypothetical protein
MIVNNGPCMYLEETKGKGALRKKYRDMQAELRVLRREQQRARRIELFDGYIRQ